MSGRDLSGADLGGSDLAGVDLSDANLANANLQGASLRDADLRGADLTGARLSGADLTNANLIDATLTDATLSGANLADAVLEPGDEGGGAGQSLSSVASSVVTASTIVLGVVLLAAGHSWAWVVFVVGFVAVLPAAQYLASWYETRSGESRSGEPIDMESDEQAALAALRDRYARGEIDEAEFERRVERLLETESVADAADAYGGDGADPEQDREPEPE